MVVLEKITAPASRTAAIGGASTGEGTSLPLAAPSGTGTPFSAILSLIVTGTPSSGPIASPFCQRCVDALAVARAPSGSKAYSALMCGSHRAMCASTSSSTSEGENCRARKPAIRSTALRSCSDATDSSDAVLCMATHRKPGFNDTRKHTGAYRQDLVIEHIARIVHRYRALMADPEISAGNGLHHIGEILATHFRLRAGEDLGWVDDRARHRLDHPGLLFLIHQHAEGVADIGRDLDIEGAGETGA